MIADDEVLFGSDAWRALEAEALAELERGEGIEFETFGALAMWLSRPDEEDQ